MNTKKLIFLLLIGLSILSCKKDKNEDAPIDQQETGVTNETSPSSFQQKVLIEEFTGEWCGYCPSGAQYLQSTISDYPGKIVAAAFHVGDPFEISTSNTFANKFNVTGYPSALIQRKLWNGAYATSRSLWSNLAGQVLQQAATGGLKIQTSVDNNSLDIAVDMALTTNDTNMYLTVYLISEDVPESAPGAQTGAQPGYVHHHVVQKVILLNSQETFSNGFVSRNVITDVDISSYDQNNLKVVAFLHHNDTGNYEVINAQEVEVGQNSDWD